jgi:hypothetical protein
VSEGQERPQNIATAITDVSERMTLLIRDEIELAKAEVTEKTTKLAKGAVVAVAAGIFFVTALFFVLIGCAWLLYFELPIGNQFTYFWGFFAMALILVVLGVLAGLLAAKVVKKSAPPVPKMAIEEARKIRESMSSPASSMPVPPPAKPPVQDKPPMPTPVADKPSAEAAASAVPPGAATPQTSQPAAPLTPQPAAPQTPQVATPQAAPAPTSTEAPSTPTGDASGAPSTGRPTN